VVACVEVRYDGLSPLRCLVEAAVFLLWLCVLANQICYIAHLRPEMKNKAANFTPEVVSDSPYDFKTELVNTGRFFENTQNTVRMLAHAKYIGNTLKYAQIYRSRFYVSRHGSQHRARATCVLREVRFVTHTLTQPSCST
jgi:hypothetical protein